MAWYEPLLDIIGLGSDIGFSTANYKLQKEQQEWDREQYKENRDYERALQERIFAREDTAMQRGVRDARRAGLSPLAATGSNAGSVVSISNAPSSDVPQFELDMIGSLQALESMKDSRFNRFDKKRITDAQIEDLEEKRKLEEKKHEEQVRHNKEQEKATEYSNQIHYSEFLQSKDEFDDMLEENKRQFDSNMSMREKEYTQKKAIDDMKISMEKAIADEQVSGIKLDNQLKEFQVAFERFAEQYYEINAQSDSIEKTSRALLNDMQLQALTMELRDELQYEEMLKVCEESDNVFLNMFAGYLRMSSMYRTKFTKPALDDFSQAVGAVSGALK